MRVIIRLFPEPAATPPRKRAPAILASANLSRLYFPGRGVFFSLVLHGLVFAGLLYVPILPLPAVKPRPRQQMVVIDLTDPDVVMYLPMMGGGGTDSGLSGGNEEPGKKGAAVAPALSREGLSYPGPQPILSNPPDSTNLIQTVLQPGLANPAVLKPPLPLPNAVLTTNAGPIPPSTPPDPPVKPAEAEKTLETQPEEPARPQPEARLLDAPLPAVEVKPSIQADLTRMVIPTDAVPPPLPNAASPDLTTLTPPPPVEPPPTPVAPPEPAPKPAPKTAPKPPQPKKPETEFKKPEPEPARPAAEKMKETLATEAAAVPTSGRDSRNLLSLTPVPALGAKVAEIPDGEARGRFMISPDPNLLTSSTEPGTKTGTGTTEVNIGSFSSTQAGNASPVVNITFGAAVAAGGGKDTSAAGSGAGAATGSGAGSGGGAGSGAGAGKGPGTGAGAGSGTGAGSGAGSGTGSGTGTGSGSGAGTGAGAGAFAGITIIGGIGNTGTAANSPTPTRTPRPLQTSYGLYVVSTENSGGGLPYFGVFSHEQVYTVYLDMRRTEMDPVGPSWTLEFAVLQETGAQGNVAGDAGADQQGLILPFPAVKEPPALPAELVRKHPGKMVIVYAVINVNGRMEQLSVKESPDPLLNQPVIDALSRWVFRPSMLAGKPVPTKMLLGIPLWLPE